MPSTRLYLGLDVHKDSIPIAIAETAPKSEIRPFGTITNDLHAVEKALSRIRKAHPGGRLRSRPVRVWDRSAPQTAQGSLPGRRSFANSQATRRSLQDGQTGCPRPCPPLLAGELTVVYVPEPTDEAIATCVGPAPMPSMICAVAGIGSRAFSCVTASAITARPTGARPICATCANWSCLTPP